MSHADVLRSEQAGKLFHNPWPALGIGLGLNFLAFILCRVGTQTTSLIGLFSLILGMLALGVAINIRPKSPLILLLATGGAGLATMATGSVGPAWDSFAMLLAFLTLVGILSTVLMFLPRLIRRLIIGVLIVVHFTGILSAIHQVPPSPWLMLYLWQTVYRPYLQFMYLNNAYHFYAPEPGPGMLVWFQVKYEDGTYQWVKIPQRQDHALTVQYQRRLSVVESVNQLIPTDQMNQSIMMLLQQNRWMAASRDGIPFHPELPQAMQYREPNEYSKRILSEYARYVAHNYKHPDDPSIKVTGVRIYRIVHSIPSPPQVKDKVDPAASWTYLPYYQGEYDSEGKPKNPPEYDAAGNLVHPGDPYRFWLIPIIEKATFKREVNVEKFKADYGLENEETEDSYDFFSKHLKLDLPPPIEPQQADEIPKGAPAKPLVKPGQ